MPIRHSHGSHDDVIRIVGSGVISLEDRARFVMAMSEDGALLRSAPILIDINGIANTPATHDLPFIAALIDRLLSRFGRRVAILNSVAGHVTMSPLVAFATLAGKNAEQVFSAEAAALEWLRC